MQTGKLNPQGVINYPGFQKILDWTATGSESTKSLAVNGDTDKEYQFSILNVSPTNDVDITLNGDMTSGHYGQQGLFNSSGTITAGRTATYPYLYAVGEYDFCTGNILTPQGAIKTSCSTLCRYVSGTTLSRLFLQGTSYTQTGNVTSIDFTSSGANFTAGTRITVYARRSNV